LPGESCHRGERKKIVGTNLQDERETGVRHSASHCWKNGKRKKACKATGETTDWKPRQPFRRSKGEEREKGCSSATAGQKTLARQRGKKSLEERTKKAKRGRLKSLRQGKPKRRDKKGGKRGGWPKRNVAQGGGGKGIGEDCRERPWEKKKRGQRGDPGSHQQIDYPEDMDG